MTNIAVTTAGEEGIQILFNNPNPEAQAGYLRLGWHATAGMQWYALPVRAGILMKEVILRFCRLPQARPTIPNAVQVDIEPAGIERALNRESEFGGAVMTDKTVDFILWRYFKAPHRSYRIHGMVTKGSLESFVVYGTACRGRLKEVQILDIFSADPDAHGLQTILNDIIKAENPHWLLFAAAPDHHILPRLRRLRFVPLPKRVPIVTRQVRELAISDGRYDSLDLTLGDLDTF